MRYVVIFLILLGTVAYAGDITGYVYDENGDPFEGVIVHISPPKGEAYTVDDGYFEFPKTPSGGKMISVSVYGYEQYVKMIPVSKTSKTHLEIDLVLNSQIPPGGRLEGTIRAVETEAPLAFVKVSPTGSNRYTFTDRNGYYLIEHIPPDTYEVVLNKIELKYMYYENVKIESGKTTKFDAEYDPYSTPYKTKLP